MKTRPRPLPRNLPAALVALLLCFLVTACEYSVPATTTPTRSTDDRLIGEWIAMDGWMKVRSFDAKHYVIFHNGRLYRAWHSEVAGLPLVTVQNIDSEKRAYSYIGFELSDDGRRLSLRVVNDKLIPTDATDTARIQKLFTDHARQPELFNDAVVYLRQN